MIKKLDLEVLRNTEPRPVPWLCHGVAAEGALTLLYGPPGCGKSLLMMAVSRAVSEGATVLSIQCKESHVLNLDAENGEEEIHRRVRALQFEKNYNPVVLSDFSIEINLSLLEDMLYENFPGLLVLDSLRTVWPEGDENDSGSVTRLLSGLQILARKYSLAIVILHHMNKMGGIRGSTALTAVPDIAIEVSKHRRDKDETRRCLRWEKCRLGPAPSKKWFAIQSDDFGNVQVLNSWAPEPDELWSD